jgi:predicted XRE-type DNA-binding protein
MLSDQAQLPDAHAPEPGSRDEAVPRVDHGPVRQILIAAIAEAMAARCLSQVQAARLCRTDQPTLSKVLRGRTSSVTVDKLVDWLLSLGRSVELRIGPTNLSASGSFTATKDKSSVEQALERE